MFFSLRSFRIFQAFWRPYKNPREQLDEPEICVSRPKKCSTLYHKNSIKKKKSFYQPKRVRLF